MTEHDVPQASELIQLPEPSWAPVLAAAGATLALVGVFGGLPYFLVGLVILVPAIHSWIRQASGEHARLPRAQELESVVIAPVPVRRADPVRQPGS